MTLLFIGMAVGVAIAWTGAKLGRFGSDVPRWGQE